MEDNKQNGTPNEESFLTKVKNGFGKFFKGVKNFFVKTGRVNSSNCYGAIDGIGDLLVYEDHALISAVGMDDVTFTKENVIGYSFEGLGQIRKKKATVKYKIVLDDKVVFPEKVREKNDVKNLSAIINIDKERSHLVGHDPIDDCDVYRYEKCFVIVFNLKRTVGEKVEKYQESALRPYAEILEIKEQKDRSFAVKFEGGKILFVVPVRPEDREFFEELKQTLGV